MIRGFLAGGLWGIVIGAVVLALTSQLADWRDLSPAITQREVEAEVVAEAPPAAVDRAPAVAAPSERAPRVTEASPRVAAGDAADEISAPLLDTLPPMAPVAGGPAADGMPGRAATAEAPVAPAAVDAPAAQPPALAVARAPEADTPPAPGETAPAPAASAPDAQAEIAERAAPAPDAAPEAPAAAVETEAAPVVGALDAQPAAPPAAAEAAPAPPEAPAPVAVAEAVQETVPESVDRAGTASTVAPASVEAPPTPARVAEAVTPAAAPEPDVVAAAPEPAPAPAPAAEVPDAMSAAASEAADDGEVGEEAGRAALQPQILQLADGGSSLPGRRVTGLPRLGEAAAEADAPEEEPAAETAENGVSEDDTAEAADGTAEAADGELSALDRNRVPFEAPEGAALIAMVLVHAGGAPLDLAGSPAEALPISFAVPAGLPDAAEVARAYREAGHEVVLIPDLPPDARARDVEVALPVGIAAIPDAVAVMDPGTEGFQDDRGATSSVLAAVSGTGHGLLTWSRGFNSAQRMAEQEGVPAAVVLRPVEAGDAGAVVRSLEQAALRARQDGSVVLAGPADPAVLEGLVTWAADSRRDDTALAPVSAVLLVR